MKKLIQDIGSVKKCTLFQDVFFQELLKKYLITKSNKYVAIYGSIYYFNKRKEDNGINLITLIDKLSFSVQHKTYRERIPLQVANLGT